MEPLAHRHERTEAPYIRVLEEQPPRHGLEMIHAPGQYHKHAIPLAGDVVALLHQRLLHRLAPKRVDPISALALQFDDDDERHTQADRRGVDLDHVAQEVLAFITEEPEVAT